MSAKRKLHNWEVDIIATVRKTMQVRAATETEAIEHAHACFSTVCDGEPEAYEEQTGDVRKLD